MSGVAFGGAVKDIVPPAGGKVVIEGRKRAVIEGVTEAVSFDENTVVAETSLGCAVVRGRGLRIGHIDVERERIMNIEGDIDSVSYTERGGKKALLSKLFK